MDDSQCGAHLCMDCLLTCAMCACFVWEAGCAGAGGGPLGGHQHRLPAGAALGRAVQPQVAEGEGTDKREGGRRGGEGEGRGGEGEGKGGYRERWAQ